TVFFVLSCLRGPSTLLIIPMQLKAVSWLSSRKGFDGRTRTDQISVAVRIVNPPDTWPVLVVPNERKRKRRLFARVPMRPVVGGHRVRRVRSVLQHVVRPVGFAVDDILNLPADRDH